MTSNKKFEKMNGVLFTEFLEFLRLPPDTKPNVMLRYPGFKSAIPIYQMFAGYIFQKIRIFQDGGILGDKTGFGKTLEGIISAVLDIQYKQALYEVEQSYADSSGEHNLRSDEAGKPCRYLVKTGEHKYPFICPCEKRFLVNAIFTTGPSLFLVGASLVLNWRREFVKHVDFNHNLNQLSVYMALGRKPTRAESDLNKRDNILTFDDQITPSELTNEATDSNGDLVISMRPRSNRAIIIMSKAALGSRFESADGANIQGSWEDMIFNNITVDECHENKNADSKLMLTMFAQPRETFILFMSATPWDGSPMDMYAAMAIIQRRWHERSKSTGASYAFKLKDGQMEMLSDKQKEAGA